MNILLEAKFGSNYQKELHQKVLLSIVEEFEHHFQRQHKNNKLKIYIDGKQLLNEWGK